MSEEHKMTSKDKLVLGITLAAIFGGVFILGLVGLIFNLSNWEIGSNIYQKNKTNLLISLKFGNYQLIKNNKNFNELFWKVKIALHKSKAIYV